MEKIQQRYGYSYILLRQLVKTDFKLRYQNSVLGYLWSLIKPLALFTILYIVFVKFLHVGDQIPNYAIYLLLGIVLWNFFSEVTVGSVPLIVGKGDLLRKLNFPRYNIILAGSFSALINLFLNLIVVSVFMIFKGVTLRITIIFFPFIIFELYIFSLALSFFLSALYVKYRDVNYIWEVILQGAFYATPILYPISLIATKNKLAAELLLLNPLAQLIQDARYLVVTDKTVTISSLYGNIYARLIPITIAIYIVIIASNYFRKRSKYFAEEI